MSVELLDKIRRIGRVLQEANSSTVVFNDVCDVLSGTLSSRVLVISKTGKILGIGSFDGVEPIEELLGSQVGERIDGALDERLLSILSTRENVNLATLGFPEERSRQHHALICPVGIAGERLGTVFIYRGGEEYTIDDIIVSEYGTTVISLAMVRSVDEETAEEEREIAVVRSAFSTLSFSEMEAILQIFRELQGTEGILVASKIADRIGITRSVIVNALRKFESAGIIESRSSGMKGTYIRVHNRYVFDALEEMARRRKTK